VTVAPSPGASTQLIRLNTNFELNDPDDQSYDPAEFLSATSTPSQNGYEISSMPYCNATHATEATTPANQARLTVGIDEKVDLTSTNGATWSASGNGGRLTTNNGANAVFTAGQTAGSETLTISGDSCTTASIQLTVITPSGLNYQRIDSNVFHTQGYGNVGIKNYVYLLPATVSFENLGSGELNAAYHATGTWACLNGMSHDPNQTMIPGGAESGSLGTPVGNDTANSGYCGDKSPTITSSTAYFAIPDVYEVNGNTSTNSGVQFSLTNQEATMTNSGAMTESKGNAVPGETTVTAASEGY
jgi:hypothetical protein